MSGGAPSKPPRRKFRPLPEWVGPSTRSVHAGSRDDANAGSVVFPIYQTSTFRYPAQYSEARDAGEAYIYTRDENPTQEVPAEIVRSLEGAEAGLTFSSGMAAISTTLLAFLGPGDEVVAPDSLYGGTLDLLRAILPRFGVRVRWANAEEARRPETLVGSATRVVYLETPTNPLLRVYDLRRWCDAADSVGAISVVDSTYATPINQRPLDHGADLVLHSGTKYLGGHSDVLAGATVGSSELVERVARLRRIFGGTLDPFAAFLLARGLKTLALRVERQNENARRVAAALTGLEGVRGVYAPGWEDDEAKAIVNRQMSGPGGVLSVEVEGGAAGAHRFLRSLQLVEVASSLGGVDSLVSMPTETSHRRLPVSEAEAIGIRPGLVRLALGIEDPDDLVRDICTAVEAARSS